MFVDSAIITVRSGRGGAGSRHLLRMKGNAKGGPDGGDGGKGGDVVVYGNPHLDTLVQFAYQPHWFATDGEAGSRKNCNGKEGVDRVIELPLGSRVFDAQTGELVADITEAAQTIVVAQGGVGGKGNVHFKSAVHQTPTETSPAGEPIERVLRIELLLIADVGFVGLPNAGKSTMLKSTTRAHPKVADYPFTTLSPQLGIAELPGERRLVLADLPGLIEGASQGAGLGHDFLRHVERTRVLLHVVDIAPVDGSDPLENHRLIRRELAEFSEGLARKRELVVLNKVDLIPEEDRGHVVEEVVRRFKHDRGVVPLVASGATGIGVREVLESVWTAVHDARGAELITPHRIGG
ncbi:MAG: GTPase ObgE [Planctomycetes bacterium]|nr:GTPase ObgE [Planctomycetota bacterium]